MLSTIRTIVFATVLLFCVSLFAEEVAVLGGSLGTVAEPSNHIARFLGEGEVDTSEGSNLKLLLARAYAVRSSKAATEEAALEMFRPSLEGEGTTEGLAEGLREGEAEIQELLGVISATDALALGDALLRENRLREAALVYFDIVDRWPDTEASSAVDNVVNALSWTAERGRVDLEELKQFTDSLPSYEACRSDKALYWLAAAQQITGEALKKANRAEEAKVYLEAGRETAKRAMAELPDSPYQIFIPGHYLRSCRLLGRVEMDKGVAHLTKVVSKQETNSIQKLGARFSLAVTHHVEYHDVIEGGMQCCNILDEYPGSEADRYVKEASSSPNIAGHIVFVNAYARFQMAYFGMARDGFREIATTHAENPRLADNAAYMVAYLTDLISQDDIKIASDAYLDYIEHYPYGERIEQAYIRLGAVYERNGELSAALEVYRSALEAFPNAHWTMRIEQLANDIEGLIASGTETELRLNKLRAQYGQSLCGPYALALLLESRSIVTDLMKITEQTGAEVSGTSLSGLIKASSEYGVTLQAVHIATETVIPYPSIAYFDPEHFVFVAKAEADRIEIEDMRGKRVLDRDEFSRLFSGIALVLSSEENKALPDEMLEFIRGRCDDFFEDLTEAYMQCINQDYVPDCPDCDTGGPGGGGGAGMSGGFPGGDGGDGCSLGFTPPGPGSTVPYNGIPGTMPKATDPSLDTNISFSGFGFGMGTNHRGIHIKQTDVAIQTQGAINLTFTRAYYNPWGGHPAYRYLETRPFKNNMGDGWGHNFNVHLRLSSNNGFACYIDANQNFKRFQRTATNQNGYDIYKRVALDMGGDNTNTLRRERAIFIRRNRNEGWLEMVLPEGNVSRFSAPIQANERYCRLEWFEDVSGNRFNLTYSSCVINTGTEQNPIWTDFGRLSRVDTPAGDNRYLTFTYSGNRISRVELRTGPGAGDVLKFVEYGYGPFRTLGYGEQNPYSNTFLRWIKADDNNDEQYLFSYEDGEYDSEPVGMYPSKLTDKNGNELNIEFLYDKVGGENFESTAQITFTYPGGLSVQYQKWTAATTYIQAFDGQTELSRFRFGIGAHGVGVDYAYYYKTDSEGAPTQNTNTWTYSYANTYDLIQIYNTNTQYWYNNDGRTTKAAYGAGSERVYWRYEYPVSGGLYPIKMYGPGLADDAYKGPMTEYAYDAQNRLISVKPPNVGSAGFTYTYDNYGQVVAVTNPANDTQTFTYDDRGNMTSRTDYLGKTWTYTHDDFGRVLTQTDPDDNTTTYAYTGSCQSCSGGASGLIASIVDPENNETTFEYDNNGNLLVQTDPMGRQTHYTYDSMNRLVEIETEDGRTQSYTYNKLGLLVAVTDFEDKITRHKYDYRGLVIETYIENDPSTSNDDEVVVQNEYNDLGQLTRVWDGKGQQINFTYNSRGQVSSSYHGSGFSAKMYLWNVFDTFGRLTKTSAYDFSQSLYDQDPVEYFYNNTTGQLTKKRTTNDSVARDVDYTYDNMGRVVNLDDWMGGAGNDGHFFDYDENGRVLTYSDFDEAELTHTYGDSGQLLGMSAYENGVNYAYTYTDAGRLATISAPGNRMWSFSYNDAGQPTGYTWPNGMNTVYTYDTGGRLTKIEHKDGATVRAGWAYALTDGGNILRIGSTVSASKQAWDYGYDSRNRLTHAVRTNDSGVPQFRMAYAYDAADNMVSKTKHTLSTAVFDDFSDGNYTSNPAWTVVSGTWGVTDYALTPVPAAGGRSIYVANSATNSDVWLRFKRGAYHTPWTDTFSVTLRYTNANTYLTLGWWLGTLILQETVSGSTSTLAYGTEVPLAEQNVWYTLYIRLEGDQVMVYGGTEESGLILAIAETTAVDGSTSRLQLHVNGQTPWAFDDVRVMTRAVDPALSATYTYNDANQMTAMTSNGVTTSFAYDAWGRMASKNATIGGTPRTAYYSYSFGDKLKVVSTNFPGETTTAYNYDGLGKRRNRITDFGGGNPELTWWRWDLDWSPLCEYADPDADWDLEGFAQFNVYNGLMHPLAEAAVSGSPANAAYSYLALDHLSSTRAVYNQAKTATASLEFYPYGETFAATGTLPDARFTAKPYDPETGLYYFPYRYYSPTASRWTSRDPLGMIDGPNVYGYVKGNSTINYDPLGQETEVCVGNMGGILGGLGVYHCAVKIDGVLYEYGHTEGYPDGNRTSDYDPGQRRGLRCTNAQSTDDGCCDKDKLKRAILTMNTSGMWGRDNYNPLFHNCCHYVDLALKLAGCKGPDKYNYPGVGGSWWLPPALY